jgi:hypothetical protein
MGGLSIGPVDLLVGHGRQRNVAPELDEQEVDDLFKYLQGIVPDRVHVPEAELACLDKKQAFAVIYFLQEHLHLIADKWEQCSVCLDLYDSNEDGYYVEADFAHYCEGCAPYHVRYPSDEEE